MRSVCARVFAGLSAFQPCGDLLGTLQLRTHVVTPSAAEGDPQVFPAQVEAVTVAVAHLHPMAGTGDGARDHAAVVLAHACFDVAGAGFGVAVEGPLRRQALCDQAVIVVSVNGGEACILGERDAD